MAKGKRRAKAQAARARKRAAKFASYERRTDSLPNEDTKYGKRWHARRRGEPMATRGHENRPWYYPVIFEVPKKREAARFAQPPRFAGERKRVTSEAITGTPFKPLDTRALNASTRRGAKS